MNFGRRNQDDEVIRLLGQLKDSGPDYPSSLYTRRRAAVMAAFAALHLGAAAVGLTLFAQIAKMIKAMGVVEKIILAAEVATVTGMTTYGAIEAYVYRDQLKDLLFPTSLSSNTPFPSLSIPSLIPSEQAGEETATPVPSGTVTATAEPFPTWTQQVIQQSGNTPAAVATQAQQQQPPPPKPTKCGNSGNCYGKTTRTPKP